MAEITMKKYYASPDEKLLLEIEQIKPVVILNYNKTCWRVLSALMNDPKITEVTFLKKEEDFLWWTTNDSDYVNVFEVGNSDYKDNRIMEFNDNEEALLWWRLQ